MVVDGFSGAYITPESTLLWLLTTKGVQLCKLHRRVDFFCKQDPAMSKVVVVVDGFPAHI